MLTFEVLKSLHTLLDKYLDHLLVKFEQHGMGPTIQNFELLTKNKKTKTKTKKTFFQNHFWQSVDAILEDVSVAKTIVWYLTINLETIIFQCSKTNGSPTSVTRLKVAPNMADPIRLNEKRP